MTDEPAEAQKEPLCASIVQLLRGGSRTAEALAARQGGGLFARCLFPRSPLRFQSPVLCLESHFPEKDRVTFLDQESRHLGPDRLRAMCCYNCQSLSLGKYRHGEGTFICEITTARVRRFFRYLPDFCHLNVEVGNSFEERPDSFPSILPVLGKATMSGSHVQCFLIALFI